MEVIYITERGEFGAICDKHPIICVVLGNRGGGGAFVRVGWEVKFLHISRGGGGSREGEGGPKRRDLGPGKPGIDPKATQNSPVLTQIGLHLARKSPGSARGWSGGMGGGVFVRGRCWGMSCWSEEKFWAVEFLLHAGGGSFFERVCFI